MSHLAISHQLIQPTEGFIELHAHPRGPVDEIQISVVRLETTQAVFTRSKDLLMLQVRRVHFRCDEEALAFCVVLMDRAPQQFLAMTIRINFGGVEVSVANFERGSQSR